mmetsp:Transcript_11126/g.23042  ORF Transcript_11126/g.23042 Transcript_11126/m.23042 type:complete len:388 (+) Transcript_11126:10-1173(+)
MSTALANDKHATWTTKAAAQQFAAITDVVWQAQVAVQPCTGLTPSCDTSRQPPRTLLCRHLCLIVRRSPIRLRHTEAIQDTHRSAIAAFGLSQLGHELLPLRQLLEGRLQLVHLLGRHGHCGRVGQDSSALIRVDLHHVELLRLLRGRRLLRLPLDQARLLLHHALRILVPPGTRSRDLDAGLALGVVDRRDAPPLHLELRLLLLEPLGGRGLDHAVEDLAVGAALLHLLRDHLQQLRHEAVVHGQLHGVREDAGVEKVREGAVLEAAEVGRGDAAGDDLPHRAQVLLALRGLLLQAALHLLLSALLGGLHALHLDELRVAAPLEVLLVPPEGLQLLLLQDLHHALLQGLAHQDLEDGLALHVEVEELAVLDLGLDVDADLRGHEER